MPAVLMGGTLRYASPALPRSTSARGQQRRRVGYLSAWQFPLMSLVLASALDRLGPGCSGQSRAVCHRGSPLVDHRFPPSLGELDGLCQRRCASQPLPYGVPEDRRAGAAQCRAVPAVAHDRFLEQHSGCWMVQAPLVSSTADPNTGIVVTRTKSNGRRT
jgi:hypothetical protein